MSALWGTFSFPEDTKEWRRSHWFAYVVIASLDASREASIEREAIRVRISTRSEEWTEDAFRKFLNTMQSPLRDLVAISRERIGLSESGKLAPFVPDASVLGATINAGAFWATSLFPKTVEDLCLWAQLWNKPSAHVDGLLGELRKFVDSCDVSVKNPSRLLNQVSSLGLPTTHLTTVRRRLIWLFERSKSANSRKKINRHILDQGVPLPETEFRAGLDDWRRDSAYPDANLLELCLQECFWAILDPGRRPNAAYALVETLYGLRRREMSLGQFRTLAECFSVHANDGWGTVLKLRLIAEFDPAAARRTALASLPPDCSAPRASSIVKMFARIGATCPPASRGWTSAVFDVANANGWGCKKGAVASQSSRDRAYIAPFPEELAAGVQS